MTLSRVVASGGQLASTLGIRSLAAGLVQAHKAAEPRISFRLLLASNHLASSLHAGMPGSEARLLTSEKSVGPLAGHPHAAEERSFPPRTSKDEDTTLRPRRETDPIVLFPTESLRSMDASSPRVSEAEQLKARVPLSLEALVPKLVRRIAWSGDAESGTLRLEIGSGELEGATLLVHAQDGRVRVRLDLPPGMDPRPWRERVVQRLASRQINADAVEVT
jgi:hypothetical protein